MTSKKKQVQIAKKMLKKSLSASFVDGKLVSRVLKDTISQKPQGLIQILKYYKRLIENALKKEEILLETAQNLTNQKQLAQKLIYKTGVKRVSFKINPKIVLGARITFGDWIYDATLGTKLEQLTINKK